ncbi:phage tail spike protein [Pontibacillus salipaludis]|uniref:Tail spike domain-containing protein n=1 Tax=Pontibacillus salipaludis TaxID=1697394 RepID=A0ABQ1PWG9_9BACI|nr:phage tail spike protein [Pontibacillus salipaludis]GGD05478.1 hypothetical protein GCM10011389_11240 [Pontibacillus salipaludis]
MEAPIFIGDEFMPLTQHAGMYLGWSDQSIKDRSEYRGPKSLFIFGRDEVLQAEIAITELMEDEHNEKIENGQSTYKFAISSRNEKAAYIEKEGMVVFKDLDGYFMEFRIKEVETIDNVTTVYTEGSHIELLNDYVRPVHYDKYTAKQLLDALLAGQRWQSGIVESTNYRTKDIKDYPTVLNSIHTTRKEFDLEVRFRVELNERGSKVAARYVDWVERRGSRTGRSFEYGKDILGFKRVSDTRDMVTALIGLGSTDENEEHMTFKNVEWSTLDGDPVDKPLGQDWVGDPKALLEWGLRQSDGTRKHIFGKHESQADTPESMLQHTWEALRRKIGGSLTYEIDVLLLERLCGYSHEKVRLGDYNGIKNLDFVPQILMEVRIIDITRSYVHPTRDKAVLGDYREIQQPTYKMIQDLQSELFRKEGLINSKSRIVRSDNSPEDHSLTWIDTSATPNIVKSWDESTSQWIKATPTTALEVGAETEVHRSVLPPEDNSKLWLDVTDVPNVLKRWDDENTKWVKVTPTDGSEIKYADGVTLEDLKPSVRGADVTSQNTAADTNKVGGTDANTVRDNAAAGKTANNTVQINKALWDRGGYINEDGTFDTDKLAGDIDTAVNSIGDSSYFYWSNGTLNAIDPEDGNNMLQINSKGIRISTDGGVNWDTAVTGAAGINADLIKVGFMLFDRLKGGTLTLGGSNNVNGKLLILNAKGEAVGDLGHGTNGFGHLIVGRLEAENVIAKSTKSLYFYISSASKASDGNTGSGFDNPIRSFAEAIRRMPKHLDHNCYIYVEDGSEIREDISFRGYSGSGKIFIEFNSSSLYGTIGFYSCTTPGFINLNSPQTIIITNGQFPLVCSNSVVDARSIVSKGSNIDANFFAIEGGALYLRDCEGYDSNAEVIRVHKLAHVFARDVVGLGGRYGTLIYDGGRATITGKGPRGNSLDTRSWDGTSVEGDPTFDAGDATPPPPPETTEKWSALSADNWSTRNYWSGDGVKQGNWGYGRRTGYWYFGSAPSNTLAGKNIKDMKVTIKRSEDGGASVPVTIYLRWHTYTSKPGGQPSDLNLSSEYTTVDLKRNQEATVTLPSSFFSHFENGTAKGVGVYVASDSTSNYAVLDSDCELIVTYEG